ncbi:hypothetical protein COB72_03690 [bacterium]|nr:MAG: hypothetical protein COB72_03690 [bacterium]
MSLATTPSSFSTRHASVATLVAGLFLSVTINLGAGLGVSEYFAGFGTLDDDSDSSIEIEPDASAALLPADKLRLGMQESSTASINWLGVIDNPEIGDVPQAEVEQAEFSKQIGNAPKTASPMPAIQPVVQPAPPVEESQPEPEPVQAIEPTPEEKTQAEKIEIELKPDTQAPILIEPQPDPIEESQAELIEQSEPIGPELMSVDPKPPAEYQPPQIEPDAQRAEPKAAGKVGVLSDRESAASIIKRAIKVNASNLHKPIVGKGLEISTVEPRFPATVRFTELPRNPVVMIQFGQNGRVRNAFFLAEGKRIYNTGVPSVDEPLLNAIYKWKAKGKQIESLDANNPESVVEISMRIAFRKEGKTP